MGRDKAGNEITQRIDVVIGRRDGHFQAAMAEPLPCPLDLLLLLEEAGRGQLKFDTLVGLVVAVVAAIAIAFLGVDVVVNMTVNVMLRRSLSVSLVVFLAPMPLLVLESLHFIIRRRSCMIPRWSLMPGTTSGWFLVRVTVVATCLGVVGTLLPEAIFMAC